MAAAPPAGTPLAGRGEGGCRLPIHQHLQPRMVLQRARGHLRAGRLQQGPPQDRGLGRAGDHQKDPLGRQDLGEPQGDGPGRGESMMAPAGTVVPRVNQSALPSFNWFTLSV